jgi:hypothetical protein
MDLSAAAAAIPSAAAPLLEVPSFGSSTLQLSSEHAMKAPKPSVDQVKTKDM